MPFDKPKAVKAVTLLLEALGEDPKRSGLSKTPERVAELVDHAEPAVVWCHYNAEGRRLQAIIPGAVEVAGGDPDERKEEVYRAFAAGQVRVLVTKPKIGAWGLNWQHCAHVVTFATHSYEQFYQAVRRCWRFGQTRPVTVDVIATEGEAGVRANMIRKAEAADAMFTALVAHMHEALTVSRSRDDRTMEVPAWLCESRQ